jgi:hypothetical protein
MVIVVVVFAVLFFLVLPGWLGLAWFMHGAHTRKRAEANAPKILRAAFDGHATEVVFKINDNSPSYETVILGVKPLGYQLTHETNTSSDGRAKTLIFEKIT